MRPVIFMHTKPVALLDGDTLIKSPHLGQHRFRCWSHSCSRLVKVYSKVTPPPRRRAATLLYAHPPADALQARPAEAIVSLPKARRSWLVSVKSSARARSGEELAGKWGSATFDHGSGTFAAFVHVLSLSLVRRAVAGCS